MLLVFLKQPNEMLSLISYHQIRSCLQIKLNQLSTEIERCREREKETERENERKRQTDRGEKETER